MQNILFRLKKYSRFYFVKIHFYITRLQSIKKNVLDYGINIFFSMVIFVIFMLGMILHFFGVAQ